MPAKKNETGIAKIVLIGLALLLLTGVVGSIVMGSRARGAAVEDAVTQARAITDSSLALVFKPDDIDAPASDLRADNLSDEIQAVVVDPSDFDTVTLWSPGGQILYTTEQGRIGNQLDGERDRIREALKGQAQTTVSGGVLSTMLPLEFESGVGEPAAIELTTSDHDITAAASPWRTSAIFIAVALIVVIGLLVWTLLVPYDSQPASVRAEHRNAPAAQPAPAPRPITVPQPGLKEEADARRMAEDRAQAAEERLSVMQEQYRTTLEELQVLHSQVQRGAPRHDPRLEERAMQAESRARQLEEHARVADERARTLEERSRELEERARLFQNQAESLQAEHEELARHLLERAEEAGDGDADVRAQQAGQEVIGLRAELEGAQTQLSLARRELETYRSQAERTHSLQENLSAVQAEAQRSRDSAESALAELATRNQELEDLRSEVRALRTEERRAAMLEDELRAAKAELQSVSASHRAEFFEREAELEEKVRAMREEFQAELARLESAHADEIATKDSELDQRLNGVEDAALKRLDDAERELAERAKRFESAEDDIAKATAEATRASGELTVARAELETTVVQLEAETARGRELASRVIQVEQAAAEAAGRADKIGRDLEAAAQENADLNRRLQEIEARRQLELADSQGRADIDDILRVTQERLAGQTEKLIAAEERAHELERQLAGSSERLEQAEGELRQQQMAQAMREIRGEGQDGHPSASVDGSVDAIAVGDAAPMEDRRATTPFMKELSFDAKKSLTRILGITQILKHKKDAKEQAQLVRQLTAHTRRLDHIVSDLADAERLVRGTVELTVRRTDLEPLIARVVEESGLDADHDVRVHTERLVVAVDPLRTEQIVAGLLRASGDRTPPKKTISIRLENVDGGAQIIVEDPEPSSDASLSPVVERFAEVQGGWARVESRESGGSSFKVFLPDGAGLGERPTGAGRGNVKVVVDDPSVSWENHDSPAMVEELHRLSTAED